MVSGELSVPSVGLAGQQASTRVASLDIFRGLTMALMIFVNDLASVHGLTRWTYHMPTNVDAMSYVDMVFPAFLFIIGMAMPLSIAQRLRRDPSIGRLWVHVGLRSFALVTMGLILANGDLAEPARMHGLPRSLWVLAGLAGALLTWGAFAPAECSTWNILRGQGSSGAARTLVRRGVGWLLLVGCFAIFRRNLAGSASWAGSGAGPGSGAWINFSYPEILGLIGCTYFGCCLLYIPFRWSRWAPLWWLLVLLALDSACMAHWISIARLPIYLWPFDNGSMPAVTMAGIVASTIFLDQARGWKPVRRIGLGLGFAAGALVLGWLLVPLGISKNRGTPTWSLWSIAACALVFSGLYWLCDVRKQTGWAAPVRAAGANTLLTYLLPDVYVYTAALFGFSGWLLRWNHGWSGVLRAVLFTAAMLALSTGLTRARVRMQL